MTASPMTNIHPSAIIDPQAKIAAGAAIGPYCVIGPHVAVGEGCRLVAHVHVTGHTAIGARTVIQPFTSLGTPPQSVKYRGGPTRLVIGADCDLREGITMNIGTEDGGGVTQVGDRCSFMAGSHVGHDCHVGNDVTIANDTVLGGHVMVGDGAVLGGQAAVHQFCRIGEGAMMSGFSGIAADLIPFGFAVGQRWPSVLGGLNIIGMRRRGFSRADIHLMRRLYRALFLGDGNFKDRFPAVERELGEHPIAAKIFAFIHAGGNRPLLMPPLRRGDTDAAGQIAADPAS
jgi:UDP-N-acetylglucosamine acyltransferase